jgi:hypothetical protein
MKPGIKFRLIPQIRVLHDLNSTTRTDQQVCFYFLLPLPLLTYSLIQIFILKTGKYQDTSFSPWPLYQYGRLKCQLRPCSGWLE